MQDFPIHTLNSAPDASKPALQFLQQAFGRIPNVAGAMASSPVLVSGLTALFQQVHGGRFSEPQIQVLLLTNAVTNACTWAVAFHSALALEAGVDAADIAAIRERRVPRGTADGALSALARTLIEKRGRLDDAEIAAFMQAGFDRSHLLEAIAVVAASTITNYTGNVAQPPLEAAFQPYAWRAA